MFMAIATALRLRAIHSLFGVEVDSVDLKHVDDDTWRGSVRPSRSIPSYPPLDTPGDLVMWDNRAMLHRGRAWDYAKHRRVMHRRTVAGEGPTA